MEHLWRHRPHARAIGSGGDWGKLESVCILCEQLLFYLSLQSFCSIARFSHVSREAGNLHFAAKCSKFLITRLWPKQTIFVVCACLCILCSAKEKHWMTSTTTSPEAFPAWLLCILHAFTPLLLLICTELQATLVLVQLAFFQCAHVSAFVPVPLPNPKSGKPLLLVPSYQRSYQL